MNKVKLREICDLKNGYAFKSKDYIEKSNTVICRMSNIRPDGKFDIDYNIKYVPDEFAEIYKGYLLEDGDVIVAMTDMANDPKIIGKPTTIETNGYNVLLNQRVGKLVFKDRGAIDQKYLKFALSVPSLRNYYKKFAGGGLQINIGKKEILNIEIPLPELNSQRRIVSVLEKALEIIDKRKAQIEALDKLTQSVFLEMFGDPINNQKEWEVKKLKNITNKILSGTTPKGGSQVYIEKGITFLRSQNVWKNRLVFDDVVYIDKETHNKMKKSSLKYGDILMTKTGRINTENSSLGRAAIFLGKNDSANINGHVYLIRLQEDIINEFILFILTTDEYREYIRSVCVGGIDKRQINKEHLEEFPIISPPIELQVQFSNLLTHVEKLKSEMKTNLNELEDNFNSLLQRSFKGELFTQEKLPNA